MKKSLNRIFLFGALCLTNFLYAELRVADIFQDQMVLQREAAVPVWGWADPQASVRVSFAGQSVDAEADAEGYWRVNFAPMPANAKGEKLVVRSGSDEVTLSDVLVGEVWVAAGQSNMRHGGPDLDTGVYPHYQSPAGADSNMPIRAISYGWGASLEPMDDTDVAGRGANKWKPSVGPDHHSGMSLSQYFARVLRDELNVPIGIILVAHAGTNQAAWMSKETLEDFPGTGDYSDYYQEFLAAKQTKLAKNKRAPYKTWEEFKAAEEAWRTDRNGRWPGRGLIYVNFPAALYNTRIHPLAPFSFRGVIWHQGEGGPYGPYDERLVAMFTQWRELFGQDFPVVWGTLSRNSTTVPPIDPAVDSFYRSLTNEKIRNAKDLFDDESVDYVEFYDVGSDNTHFMQKAEAGRRMALGALNVAYGQDNVFTGPRLVNSKIDGGTVLLRFDHVGEGMTFEPSIEGASGVYLLNAAGDTRWANVEQIDGNTFKASHPDIRDIAVAAYGASTNPLETLFNSEGLPASPFEINPKNQRLSKDRSARQLAEVVEGNKVAVSLNHVRRNGYVFNVVRGKSKGVSTARIQAYVPSEWSGVEVLVDGQPIAAEVVQNDGSNYVLIDADVGGPMIIVADKGQGDGFKNVNRY